MILALWSLGWVILGMSPGYIWGYAAARRRFERKRDAKGRMLPNSQNQKRA